MFDNLLRHCLTAPVRRSSVGAIALFNSLTDPVCIASWQLKRFNELWQGIHLHVPFYHDLVKRNQAPDYFRSWTDFSDSIPLVSKEQLRDDIRAFTDTSRPPTSFRTSGGTTAEPFQMPSWRREEDSSFFWVGRHWYGIRPGDRLFLLWGHSHLLGTGIRGTLRRIIRNAKDRGLGYCRWSAYDISNGSMERACDALISFRPDFIIGYGVALDALSIASANRKDDLHKLHIKAVIGTAESFPSRETRNRLSACFNAPVAMEYGAIETGVIAHSHPSGGYRTMWPRTVVETPFVGPRNGRRVILTSLYPRACPLVRYDIGDEVKLIGEDPTARSATRFLNVLGRCNDVVTLSDGRQLHSELFTHLVKDIPQVERFQIVSTRKGTLLLLKASTQIGEKTRGEIQRRLSVIDHTLLHEISIITVDRLESTRAGKTPMVLDTRFGSQKSNAFDIV